MKNIKNNKNNPQDLPSDPQWEEEWESDEFMQELQHCSLGREELLQLIQQHMEGGTKE